MHTATYGWCLMHYKRWKRHGSLEKAQPIRLIKAQQTCTIEDCDKPARTKTAEFCAMHYHRQYRHGDTEKTAVGSDIVRATTRYRRVSWRGHPLANKYGLVWEHRAVLYDKIGPAPQVCHHGCGNRIVWFVVDPVKNDPRLIYADHLDFDRGNNSPDNLVPSCYRCNQARGLTRRHQMLTTAGWWSNNDTVAKTNSGRTSRFDAR